MSRAHSPQGLLSVLAEDPEGVVDEWAEVVATSLRGRVTRAEIRVELAELYRTLRAGIEASGGGSAAPDPEAFADLRILLSELSRNRAIQGFSPRETAVSVFSLKDVVARRGG